MQTLNPRQHIADPALKRRWQPTTAPSSIEEARRAIAGVALAAGTATSPALIESSFHLLAPMREIGGPHHLPCRIVDHGQPRGLAARIDLHPEWRGLLGSLAFSQYEREGVSPEHGRPSPSEQMPGTARMHRSARSALLIYDQYHRHDAILSDSPCGGNVPLVRVWERLLCPTHWPSHPICLFNAGLVELGAGTPPQGTNMNTPPKRLLAQGQGTGQHRGSYKPPPSGMESLTSVWYPLRQA
jgi:hypothetical protein